MGQQAIRSGDKGYFVVRKSGEMAASQTGCAAALQFEQERSFESMEKQDGDAAEVRPWVSQTQRRPLRRLQKRVPAKLQLKRLPPESMGLCCRSPIPLLSPLVLSPSEGGGDVDRLLFNEVAQTQNQEEKEESVGSVVIPKNGWQHPAAPFFAERVCSLSNGFV